MMRKIKKTGPFIIALKSSACEASPEIAAFREELGKIIAYEYEGEATQILIDDITCIGLQFQAAAPNDLAGVGAYLVKLRDPEPSPTERGPPKRKLEGRNHWTGTCKQRSHRLADE